jgi:3-dehydroquinate synthase
MIIKSSIRNYELLLTESSLIKKYIESCDYYIVDKKVLTLYPHLFKDLDISKLLLIDAIESNKNFQECEKYLTFLVKAGLKRGQKIAGIGGGIIQDITGFISSIIYRGIDWVYFPTTLLSQCDSCIGGKTSINFLGYKNLIGNFNPPTKIYVDTNFLKTLEKDAIQSGIGEIIKIAMIDKNQTISEKEIINATLNCKISNLLVEKALSIKKDIIEVDEFDKGIRNVMNYGHTFGHAIESITNNKIPHGIAVGIGIRIANSISEKINKISLNKKFKNIDNEYLKVNKSYVKVFINNYNKEYYINSLLKDKKNTNNDSINCILPFDLGNIKKVNINKSYFYENIDEIIKEIYANTI